jgi:hypothetical protein
MVWTSERDGVCYPVTHVLPTVMLLNHAETLRTGQHAPSGTLPHNNWVQSKINSEKRKSKK